MHRSWALVACILLVLPAAAAPVPRATYGVELSFAQPFPDDIRESLELKVTTEGVPVTYYFLLTNRGEMNDSYDLLSAGAPAGWSGVLNMTSVDLAPSASAQLSLWLAPPLSLSPGLQSWALLTVWARSRYDPTCSTHLHMLTLVNTTVDPVLVVYSGPGQQARSAINVRNTGSENDTMALEASYVHHEPNPVPHQPGDSHAPTPWSYSLTATSLRIPPGGVANTTAVVGAPAGAAEGDYLVINVTARSGLDPSKTSRITVVSIVSFRYGVRLECDIPVRKVLGGETARFSINVTNIGTMRDTVSISRTDPPPGWMASLGALSVVLDAGERRSVELDVFPPVDAPPNATARVNATGTSRGNISRSDSVSTLTVANPDLLMRFNTTEMVHHVDPGATTTFSAGVRNWGYMPDTAIFDIIGDPGDWTVGLEPSSLALPARASGTVSLNVTAPVGALAGETKDLTIRCRSLGDPGYAEAALTRTIVNRTHNLTAWLVPRAVLVDPGQGAQFSLTVFSDGNGEETARLDAGRIPANWMMEFNESAMVLGPHSSRTVTCMVTPDVSAPAGDYSVTAAVVADWTRLEPECVVQVDRSFWFSLAFTPEELTVAPGGAGEFNLTITNRGNTDDTVELSLQPSGQPLAMNWTLERASVALPLRGSASVKVRVEVPPGTPAGARDDCRVRATSAGNASFWKEVTPAGIAGVVHRLQTSGSPPLREVLPGQTAVFGMVVENAGNGPEDVAIGISGAPGGWAVTFLGDDLLPSASFRMAGQQVRRINFSATPPQGALAGNYSLEPEVSFASGLKGSVRFEVRVLQVHALWLAPERQKLVVRAGSVQSVPVSVRNLGNGPDEIRVSVKGTGDEGWATLNASALFLGVNGTGALSLQLRPPGQLRAGTHTFRLEGTAGNGTTANATLEVRVVEREVGTTADSGCYVLVLLLLIAGTAMALLFRRARKREPPLQD